MRFFIVFFLTISAAFADEHQTLSGTQWLEKVNHALKTRSFHGVVAFLKNGQLDTMKYQHGFENGEAFERLTSLNSPLREVTRKASEVICLHRETRETVNSHHPIDSSFIVNLPDDFSHLDDHYLVALADQAVVASRPAQMVAVLPKDDLRYARKLWIDKETYLPLKVEVYGLDGNTLEEALFTELVVEPLDIVNHASVDEEQQHARHHHIADPQMFEKSAFQLKNWPAGFETVFFVRNSLQKGQKSVDHLLITDGFASISIYFENKGAQPIEGARNLGSVNSFSRVLGDLQVTVLGEVPAKTVEFVAAGVALR